MPDVTLRNINPLGDVQIPSLGIEVAAGETFTVPDDVAGKAPTVNADGVVKDLGKGLLAQAGNYELATTKKKD